MSVAIRIQNLWKQYRLGVYGHGMLFRDLQSWAARIRNKEDPNSTIDSISGNGRRTGGTVWALRDVSLDIEQGEVLGIIGGNGAGKSTLLKIISKVTAPTRGEVKIRGRVASLLEVGTGFHHELTGRENVFLNGAVLGMTKAEIKRKFDEIVDFSGVDQYIDTPVKRYSSGMKVRLAFAVAAHLEPEILVVDEVLAVGDASFQRKCLGKMEGVAKQGRTILFVSHNMASVDNLCSRTVLLESGHIRYSGDTQSAIERYTASLGNNDEPIVNLVDHPNRRPHRYQILSKLEIRVNGKTSKTAKPGDTFEFILQTSQSSHHSVDTQYLDYMVCIENLSGQRLICLGTEYTNRTYKPYKGEVTVTCTIRNVPLNAGQYGISVFAYWPGKEAGDAIDRAATFLVIGSDYFESGRIPPLTKSIFLHPAAWRIEPTLDN